MHFMIAFPTMPHERAEPAERGLRLGVELLGERKVALEATGGERLAKERASLRRRERHRVRRQRAPVQRPCAGRVVGAPGVALAIAHVPS